MASPVVEELVNAAGRALTIKSAADRLLNTATPLLRRAMEQRASAAEAKARAASPATRAPVSSPEVETIDPVVPQQGMVEDSPQSLRSGPMVPQAQLQQQQRIEGGMRGLEVAARNGDPDAARMLDEAERRFTDVVMKREQLSYGGELARRDETGVYIPPRDPTPRFSIDDSASRISPEYLRTINDEADRIVANNGAPRGWGSISEGVRILPLGNRAMANLKLGDILDHPELYRYYPEAKNIKVRRQESSDLGTASYNPRDNIISLRPTWESIESARSSIIHELQHYVQTKEGFARGGSPAEFLPPELRDPKKVEERLNLLDRKVEIYENRLKLDPENTRTRDLLDDAFLERERVFKQLEDANTEYRRLLGEKEARDAQARLNMTPLERELNPPVSLNEKAMADAKVLQTNQSANGNIVPGASFEQGHIVFHGGPVSAIDRFMLKYIGTGEGAIMRGWGFYFAERPGVSAGYRQGRASEKRTRADREAIFEINPTIWDRNIPGTLKAAEEKISDLILEQAKVTDTLNSSLGEKATTTFQDILSSKTRFLGLTPGITSNSSYNSIASWIADKITTYAYNGKVRRVSSIENLAEKISDDLGNKGVKNLEALGEAQQLHGRFDEYLDNELNLVIKNIEEGLTDKQFRSLLDDGVLSESGLSNSLVNGFLGHLEPRTRNIFGVIVGDAKQEIALNSEFRFMGFGHPQPYTKEEMLAYTRRFKQALVNASNAAEDWLEEEIQTLNRLLSPDYEFDLDSVIEVAIKNEEFFRFELPGSPSVKDDAGLFVLDLKANPNLDYIHLDKNNFGQSGKVLAALNDIFTKEFIEFARNGEVYIKRLEDIYNRIDHYMNTTPAAQRRDEYSRFVNELVGEGITYKSVNTLMKVYKMVKDQPIGHWDNRKFASLVMKEFEIPGSAHWDAKSRDPKMPKADRRNNFVIWDEDIIEQLAVQPHSWAGRGKLEVDPTDHPPTDEYKPSE